MNILALDDTCCRSLGTQPAPREPATSANWTDHSGCSFPIAAATNDHRFRLAITHTVPLTVLKVRSLKSRDRRCCVTLKASGENVALLFRHTMARDSFPTSHVLLANLNGKLQLVTPASARLPRGKGDFIKSENNPRLESETYWIDPKLKPFVHGFAYLFSLISLIS